MPRKYDDDDDDRPRPRRRSLDDMDDMDDDDRPRRRRRAKPEGQSLRAVGITAVVLSVLGMFAVIVVGAVVLNRRVEKKLKQMDRDAEAQMAREEAERERELARAAADVQAAGRGGAIELTATHWYFFYVGWFVPGVLLALLALDRRTLPLPVSSAGSAEALESSITLRLPEPALRQ